MGSGYKGYLNTEGAEKRFKPTELMNELRHSGAKFSEKDVILITKNYNGKLIWLENGNDRSGLQHILKGHKNNFKGENIIELIKELSSQKPLRHIERNEGKQLCDVFLYKRNGNEYLLAYGDNGYIVTFYRISRGKNVYSKKNNSI